MDTAQLQAEIQDIEDRAEESDDLAYTLRDIQDVMERCIRLTERTLRKTERSIIRERAEAYWIPQIKTALSEDHGYLGGCMVTMEATIREIEED